MPTRDRKLQELAAISQLYQGINGPQVRQQESQQQNALAILGLLMQQQHQARQGGQEEAQLAETKRFHDASLGQATAESTDRQKATSDTNQSRLTQEFIQQLMSDPSIPHEQKMAGISKLSPQFADAITAMHTAGVQAATDKAAPAFSSIYQVGAKDPKALGQLDTLRAALPAEVFNNQDWGKLNSSLPSPQATVAASAPRTGGIFGKGGEVDFSSQIPPNLAAQYAQLPLQPGGFDWLLGSKPGVVKPQYDSVGSDLIKKLFGK